MTDEEYERIKEAEKKRLRVKARVQKTMDALKRQHTSQSIVQRMVEDVQRLLQENEALIDALTTESAQKQARAEVATEGAEEVESIQEAEEELRQERAEALVRRYKSAVHPSSSRSSSSEEEAETSSDSSNDVPGRLDKTIGRMTGSPSNQDEG